MADNGFINRLACVIGADGSIIRGFMIDKCQLKGEHEYLITWQVPLQGDDAKTNFAGTIGSATGEYVEPVFITVGLTKNPNEMQIHTYDINGKPARRPFHIACFRDH